MSSRSLIVAATALAIAGAASAEPAKPAPQVAQPAKTAQVVLASAEQLRTPEPIAQAEAAAPAKKPRAARVTTCRCAGQSQPTDH